MDYIDQTLLTKFDGRGKKIEVNGGLADARPMGIVFFELSMQLVLMTNRQM